MATESAYRRTWQHGTSRGQERKENCGFCGCLVPRWKAFPVYKRFSIGDPLIKQTVDRKNISLWQRKIYACPGCARFRGIVQIGKSRKTRPSGTQFLGGKK